MWRYRDSDNYYVARVNALEDNVVLYKVDVPAGAWSLLRVTVRGSVFVVHFDDQQLFEVEDPTFTAHGKIGVWTKADSVTYFDDLTVAVNR